MKTIKFLKIIIDILLFILIGVLIAQVFLWIGATFFSDLLPIYFKGLGMLYSFFSWKIFLVPMTAAINYVLFIVSIFCLRKSISSFLKADFYNETVTKNLKRAGNIFVFIGLSTILINIFSIIYTQNMAMHIISGIKINIFYRILSIAIASIQFKSVFSIVVGLFFLLFSKIFENSRALKQENDLTI